MFVNVVRYAIFHSGIIKTSRHRCFFPRICIFIDMIYAYLRYNMFTKDYVNENYYDLKNDDRTNVGNLYKKKNKYIIEWMKENEKDRKLFVEYCKPKYELMKYRNRRNMAYTKRFGGKSLFVGYNVNICRQHYLDGKLILGSNIYLNRNIWIDYSGGLTIGNNVSISNGVMIETHSHKAFSNPSVSYNEAKPTSLLIESDVIIGSNAIILESCNKIGRGSRIGAGSVCLRNVPPYSVVMGNPAKVISFLMTPDEIVEYELMKYSDEERLPKEELERTYNKYYINKIRDIKDFLK